MINPIHFSRLTNHLVRSLAALCLTLFFLGTSAIQAATLVVSNTGDSGAGTLRQAILDANTNSDLDTITFQIPGAGVHTLSPLTTLPAVTEQVVINGASQPGYVSQPLIELNGTSAGGNAGLRLLGGNSTVRGLAINRFQTHGIEITGPGTNLVVGNYLGTDPTGLIARPNAFEGVLISLSTNNVIGGTNLLDRNLISGNAADGIYILNGARNVVLGNFIGTTVTGIARLDNGNNGVVVNNSSDNLIGGTNVLSRNILSGNLASGIFLKGAGASGNLIQGNYIGTDLTGTLSVSNGADGISCESGLNNNIGGTNAGARNIISGNGFAGVSLSGGAAGNVVQGNFLGSDVTGVLPVANSLAGVTISGATSNLIGGAFSGARNVISGNKQDGVFITAASAGNTVAGNFIGLKASGVGILTNFFNGVTLNNASSNALVGNVISGNASYGAQILSNATGNLLQGNFIGTDQSGTIAAANKFSGVRLESAGNLIGLPGAGNVIAGNGQDGIFIFGVSASNNLVQANLIGTAASGSSGLGNGRAGIGISSAPGNFIGVPGAGNVISDNKTDAGIYLIGSAATRNQIQGNTIGAVASGNAGLGNFYEGIYLERAATNTIGGTAPGAGNLVSGNSTRGIWLTNASWNVIQGNFIGAKSDGVSALGNVFHNVECEIGACNNTIGGSAPGAGNRVAFAQSIYAGVRIRIGSTNNAILGNAIFSNGALGIDLGPAGVTANDPGDPDTGANMQQNFPVLTQAVSSGTGVGVRGTFNSRPSKTFLLQFFASPVCDGTGYGEGQIYLGEKSVTTAASGDIGFVATFPASVPVGYVVTGTATDSTYNTSEFSACFTIGPVPPIAISIVGGQQIALSWPNTTTGFVLQQTASLATPITWTVVTNVPANSGGNFVVTLPIVSTNRFFSFGFQ